MCCSRRAGRRGSGSRGPAGSPKSMGSRSWPRIQPYNEKGMGRSSEAASINHTCIGVTPQIFQCPMIMRLGSEGGEAPLNKPTLVRGSAHHLNPPGLLSTILPIGTDRQQQLPFIGRLSLNSASTPPCMDTKNTAPVLGVIPWECLSPVCHVLHVPQRYIQDRVLNDQAL